AGLTPQEVMYDYDKCCMAFKKFTLDFEPDVNPGAGIPGSGRVFDILDYKLYAWPGHGVSPQHPYQCREGEYMTADEYDALIQDPSYFFTSTYFPRIFGKLEPFKMLPNLASVQEIVFVGPSIIPFGMPDVQAAYKTLFEAAGEALKWAGVLGAFNEEMTKLGFPSLFGGFWGPELKWAGYDGVFISGISPKPVYLLLSGGKAELRNAAHLWGKDTSETDDILQQELGLDKLTNDL
ncbi:unnamed protein product, partial [marine sediment metagenome]